jgi:hypothetical protein
LVAAVVSTGQVDAAARFHEGQRCAAGISRLRAPSAGSSDPAARADRRAPGGRRASGNRPTLRAARNARQSSPPSRRSFLCRSRISPPRCVVLPAAAPTAKYTSIRVLCGKARGVFFSDRTEALGAKLRAMTPRPPHRVVAQTRASLRAARSLFPSRVRPTPQTRWGLIARLRGGGSCPTAATENNGRVPFGW